MINQQNINHSDAEDMKIDIVHIYHAVLEKAWAIILGMVVGGSLMFGYTKTMLTPEYQANAMIYLLGTSTSITSMADIQIGSILTVDFETIARSRPVVEQVMDTMDLELDYQTAADMLSIQNLPDTRILRLTVTNPDPELAKNIANEWATITSSRIADIMNTDKPSILEWAVTPTYPVTPNTEKNVSNGAVLGGALVLAFVVIRFCLNDRIHTEEQIEKCLGLPVLSIIPVEKKKRILRYENQGKPRR